jgi:hypothetical protein
MLSSWGSVSEGLECTLCMPQNVPWIRIFKTADMRKKNRVTKNSLTWRGRGWGVSRGSRKLLGVPGRGVEQASHIAGGGSHLVADVSWPKEKTTLEIYEQVPGMGRGTGCTHSWRRQPSCCWYQLTKRKDDIRNLRTGTRYGARSKLPMQM